MLSLMAAALVMAAPTLLTSCDDDPFYDNYYDNWGWNDDYYDGSSSWYDENNGNTLDDEADVLQGEWDGKMAYTNSDNGEVDYFNANMTFVRNSSDALKGTGTEVDYHTDNNGKVTDRQTLKFNWYISNNGNIHVKYLTQNQTAFVMDASASKRGFSLNERTGRFSGFMIGTNTKDMIQFDLYRVQNNDAKKLVSTRAAKATLTFGKATPTAVTAGKAALTDRR